MEPASPLKSITNTAQLAPPQKQQQNGGASSTNGSTTGSIEENANLAMWTPNASLNTNKQPQQQRSNYNGLTNAHSLFSIDDNNSLFNAHNNTKTTNNNAVVATTNGISLNKSKVNNFNHHQHNNLNHKTNGINLSNSHNGNGINSNGLLNGFQIATNIMQSQQQQKQQQQHVITKNSLNPQAAAATATSNLGNNNLFTPDADFVADFSKANIFNAMNSTATMQSNNNNNKQIHMNGNGTTIDNVNAKISRPNGMHKMENGNTNGTPAHQINENENFADFEHNTIYNAAGNNKNFDFHTSTISYIL